MEGFYATRNSSGYCDWPQSNAEKRGAVKDKLFSAFIMRRRAARGAAQRGTAQCGTACSVAPAMINSTVYLFLKRGVRWGHTLRHLILE